MGSVLLCHVHSKAIYRIDNTEHVLIVELKFFKFHHISIHLNEIWYKFMVLSDKVIVILPANFGHKCMLAFMMIRRLS